MPLKKIRLTIFIIIHLILLYFTIGYTTECCGLGYYIIPYIQDSAPIDGEDFSAVFNVFIFFTNGILEFIASVLYILITAIASCLLILPFYFLSVKKETIISDNEVKITKNIIFYSWAFAYIICAIITAANSLGFFVVISLVPFLLELMYLRKIKKANHLLN